MKRDLSVTLKDFDGNNLTEAVIEDGQQVQKPVSAQALCVRALMSNDEKASGEDKLKRYRLAEKIHASAQAELSAEDITLLKQLIGVNFTTIVVGFMHRLLEDE